LADAFKPVNKVNLDMSPSSVTKKTVCYHCGDICTTKVILKDD